MKLQFDPDQPFQRDAVAAVADLFEGQPRTVGDMSDPHEYSLAMKYGITDRASGIAEATEARVRMTDLAARVFGDKQELDVPRMTLMSLLTLALFSVGVNTSAGFSRWHARCSTLRQSVCFFHPSTKLCRKRCHPDLSL